MAISGTASVYLPADNAWASIGTQGAVGWGRSNTSTVPQSNVGTWRFVAPTQWNGAGVNADWTTAENWSNGGPATGQAYSFGALAAGGQATASNAAAAAVVPAIRFLGLNDPEYSNAAAYTLIGESLALKGSIVSRSTNNQTINTALDISGGGGLIDTGVANITIGGIISGTNAVTKWGAGKLLLTNSSNYTSNVTTVAAGTLQLDFGPGTTASNILPSTTAVTIGSATLLVNSASSGTQTQQIGNPRFAANSTTSAAAAAAAAITLVSNGTGNVALTAGDTWTRNTGTSLNISLGAGSTLTSSPSLSTTSNVVRGSGTTAFAVVSGAATTDWATVSGGNVVALSGSGYSDDGYAAGSNTNVLTGGQLPGPFTTDTLAFRTAQATTLSLIGGNTLALGGLLVGAQVGSNNTLIDGPATLTSGSNELVVHQYSTGTLEIATALVNNGTTATALTKTGPGKLVLSNTSNTYTGVNYLLGGTVSVAADTSLGTSGGLVFNGGTLQVTGGYASTARAVTLLDAGGTIDVANDSGSFTVSAAMNGIGMMSPLTKAGSGTLILTGNSSYQGTTTISGGTLQIGNGATNARIGTGAVINDGTLAFNHSDVMLFPNMVSGAGNLTRAGTGTVSVTRANTYAGGTTVSAGTLAVNNASGSGTGTGPVTVHGTGSLGGGGIIGGNVFVNAGGTLAPGDLIGTLTIGGNLTLASGSFSRFEINASSQGLNVADKLILSETSTLAYGGTLRVSLLTGSLQAGQSWDLFEFTSGNQTSLFANDAAFNGVLDYSGGDLPTLTGGLMYQFDYGTGILSVAVPEPGTLVLAGVGLAGALWTLRRHSRVSAA